MHRFPFHCRNDSLEKELSTMKGEKSALQKQIQKMEADVKKREQSKNSVAEKVGLPHKSIYAHRVEY